MTDATVITFPSAALESDEDATPVSVESRCAAAEELGLLPSDRKISDELAVKLIANEVWDSAFDDIKQGKELSGRLDSRARPVALGRTTLEKYNDVVASVKVWKDAAEAQRFADYENCMTPRTYPEANYDTSIPEDVTLKLHGNSFRDGHWKVEVI